MKRKLTLSQACSAYPHRYTLDHIPAWARVKRPDGSFYAPQFVSDADWYHKATFPGEPGLHGNCKHMISGVPSWPLGESLNQAPGTAIALYRRKQEKAHNHAF